VRNRDYREHKKLNGGPGGWRCTCCNPYRTEPRNMKARAHRLSRRVSKHRLNNDFRKIEID